MRSHVVIIDVMDQREGKMCRLAFAHHDPLAAEVLRSIVLTMRDKACGAIYQFSSERMEHLSVKEVHGPAALEVLEASGSAQSTPEPAARCNCIARNVVHEKTCLSLTKPVSAKP